jgi:hypothetical protein
MKNQSKAAMTAEIPTTDIDFARFVLQAMNRLP